MFCTQCGAPLVEDASFCGSCGWRRSTAQDVRAEVEAREGRGLKLCIKCRSEIPIDATVCHRCDALQPGADAFGAPAIAAPVLRQWTAQPAQSQAADSGTPPLATIGRRIAAFAIDVIVLVFASVIVAAVQDRDLENGQSDGNLLLFVAIMFSYFIIAEALFGQTAGKRATGIRVVTEEGEPIGWGKSAGRNLLRVVDSLPALYVVGIIVMARSDKIQRVGDRAARTIVVMDKH
ncbi:hypothetical protein BH23CHL4_BH23CHL4_20130 [soil metagenome]